MCKSNNEALSPFVNQPVGQTQVALAHDHPSACQPGGYHTDHSAVELVSVDDVNSLSSQKGTKPLELPYSIRVVKAAQGKFWNGRETMFDLAVERSYSVNGSNFAFVIRLVFPIQKLVVQSFGTTVCEALQPIKHRV